MRRLTVQRKRHMAKILSIDLGTTYFKISLFDRNGRLCDTCRIAPPIVAAQAGYMELPADAFGDVILRGIAELRGRSGGDLSDVEAVTFATQTNSFVLLDAEDRPLTPLILWPDRRAADLDAEVRRRCDIPGFSATTGIPRIELPMHAGKAALAAESVARDMEAGEQDVSDQRLPDASSDGQARDGSGRGRADGPGRYPSLPVVSRDAGPLRDRRAIVCRRLSVREPT